MQLLLLLLNDDDDSEDKGDCNEEEESDSKDLDIFELFETKSVLSDLLLLKRNSANLSSSS